MANANPFAGIAPETIAKLDAAKIGILTKYPGAFAALPAESILNLPAATLETIGAAQATAAGGQIAPQQQAPQGAPTGGIPDIPDEPEGFGTPRIPEGTFDISFDHAEYGPSRNPNMPKCNLFEVFVRIDKIITQSPSREPTPTFDENPPRPCAEGEIRRWSSPIDPETTKGKAGRERAAQLRVALASARGAAVSTPDFTNPANPLAGLKLRVTVPRIQARNKYWMYNPTFLGIPKSG